MYLLLTFDNPRDQEVFEAIYARYRNLMLYKAFHITQDRMLAQDAVNEAFLRIYRNIHKIDDPASNRCVAFIITIVKNVALTMIKRYSAKEGELADYTPDSFDLEQQVIDRLSAAEIYELVDALGEEYKSVFVLKYAYDLSHKEIGKMLGISENNVNVRLYRSKKMLAAQLQQMKETL